MPVERYTMGQVAVGIILDCQEVPTSNRPAAPPRPEWIPLARTARSHDSPDGEVCYANHLYRVGVTNGGQPVPGSGVPLVRVRVVRVDGSPVADWRDLQRIKDEIAGPEAEAVQLFPSQSRLVDTTNEYHLYVLADERLRFPFGFDDRMIAERRGQRPFDASDRPADCLAPGQSALLLALADAIDSGDQAEADRLNDSISSDDELVGKIKHRERIAGARTGDPPWTRFASQGHDHRGDAGRNPTWRNSRYWVELTQVIEPSDSIPVELARVTVRRIDRKPIANWRDLQRIKNELGGRECEAVMLFPAESRLLDSVNDYHIYLCPDDGYRFPFGTNWRIVSDALAASGCQEPFEADRQPADNLDADQLTDVALEVLRPRGTSWPAAG